VNFSDISNLDILGCDTCNFINVDDYCIVMAYDNFINVDDYCIVMAYYHHIVFDTFACLD
jgi:hypothetical protein